MGKINLVFSTRGLGVDRISLLLDFRTGCEAMYLSIDVRVRRPRLQNRRLTLEIGLMLLFLGRFQDLICSILLILTPILISFGLIPFTLLKAGVTYNEQIQTLLSL
jgi:hypothetical protein